MSLDPPMTEAEIRALAERRAAGRLPKDRRREERDEREHVVGNVPFVMPALGAAVAPGPNSPLRAQGATRKKREDKEHPIQVDVIAWADDPTTLPQFPELRSLYAIPNWFGTKTATQGARAKAEGRRDGMPDLVLPTPRRGEDGRVYGALYVEMKDESGAVRQSQRERIAMLRAAGNRCEVAMSADAAKAIITQYLNLRRP